MRGNMGPRGGHMNRGGPMSRGNMSRGGGVNMHRGGSRGHHNQVGSGVMIWLSLWGGGVVVTNVVTIVLPFSLSSSSREVVTAVATLATLETRMATLGTTGTAVTLATGTAWTRPRPSTRAGSRGSVHQSSNKLLNDHGTSAPFSINLFPRRVHVLMLSLVCPVQFWNQKPWSQQYQPGYY